MCLQLGFVFFWRKDFGPKTAHKLLVKLTPTFLLEEQLQYLRQDIQNDQINCDNQQNIFYYFSDCIFADRLYKLAHFNTSKIFFPTFSYKQKTLTKLG